MTQTKTIVMRLSLIPKERWPRFGRQAILGHELGGLGGKRESNNMDSRDFDLKSQAWVAGIDRG